KASTASKLRLAYQGERRTRRRAWVSIWFMLPTATGVDRAPKLADPAVASEARSFPLIVYELRGLLVTVKGFAVPAPSCADFRRVEPRLRRQPAPPGSFPPGSDSLRHARRDPGRSPPARPGWPERRPLQGAPEPTRR